MFLKLTSGVIGTILLTVMLEKKLNSASWFAQQSDIALIELSVAVGFVTVFIGIGYLFCKYGKQMFQKDFFNGQCELQVLLDGQEFEELKSKIQLNHSLVFSKNGETLYKDKSVNGCYLKILSDNTNNPALIKIISFSKSRGDTVARYDLSAKPFLTLKALKAPGLRIVDGSKPKV